MKKKPQKVLRCYFTVCTLKGPKDPTYKRRKEQRDFPPETTPGQAIDAICTEYGQIDPSRLIAPSQYAEVSGCVIVDKAKEPKPSEATRAIQSDLLTGAMLRQCLSEKPA